MIFRHSVLDNQDFWQVFENEEHIVEFIMLEETKEQEDKKYMSL
jgi:hypothetical protein